MKILIEKAAAKYLERLNEPMKSRILGALQGLENEPPSGDIKATSGNLQGMYRLRKAAIAYCLRYGITQFL
ncbi:hypothetical protein FACS1894204_13660 [Synergistales bacterium]|nr:hypothetical protein FACS1894204_13660 [Synergistales bacterium]